MCVGDKYYNNYNIIILLTLRETRSVHVGYRSCLMVCVCVCVRGLVGFRINSLHTGSLKLGFYIMLQQCGSLKLGYADYQNINN